jgi:NAD(P)H-hydrate epimerase
MLLVTAREMQAIDRDTIAGGYARGLDLMEAAGAAAALHALAMIGDRRGSHVEVVCGKGNNGGDGLVVARHLAAAGMHVRAHLTHPPAELSPLGRVCAERVGGAGLEILPETIGTEFNAALAAADLCVDAVLGTGVAGPLHGRVADVIEALARCGRRILAVDIPSGVDGDTGVAWGVVPRAEVTVTFGAPKIGHAFFPGRGFCGRLVVEPIGFPAAVIAAHAVDRHWVDRDLARSWLPPLSPTAHKYARGSVLVVAGSRRYTGAATLASLAALRAGAGIVQLATPESVRPILQTKSSEVIVHGVAETVDGSIALSALDELRALLRRVDALVVGPGLGPSTATHDCVAALLDSAPMPAVVDADALAALAAVAPGAPRIVTPHAGELARWTGDAVPEAAPDRIAHARAVASGRGVVLLAKGAPTIVACQRGDVFVNSTGHAGLATAGSGDVLAGVVGGLLAQGVPDPAHAAALGAWVHGRAAEIASAGRAVRGLIASDLLAALPRALAELET